MSRLKILILAVAASVMMLGAAQVWAESKCHEWTADVQITAVNPSNPFGEYTGTAIALIDGQTVLKIADDEHILQVKTNSDGSIQLLVESTWTLPDGSTINMNNIAVLTPTANPYVYNIDAGVEPVYPPWTGFLQGAFGHLRGHGIADFSTLRLQGVQKGKMCW